MDHPGPQNDNKKLLKTIMSKSLQLCTDLSSFSICSFMFLFFVNTTLLANLFSFNSSGNNNHNLINQSIKKGDYRERSFFDKKGDYRERSFFDKKVDYRERSFPIFNSDF